MLKLDQQDLILQRIQSQRPIFKTVGEIEQSPKIIKSREAIQRSILSQIQRSVVNTEMDPLAYGQKELKDVMTLLEEQLKTVILPPLSYEEKKKQKFLMKQESKQMDFEESNHPKKQRVDKNKCRKCKNSTIPMILDLLKQTENQDTNPHVTMKSIRQSIVQKSQKKEEQSESKVPYIAFDYSDRIVICKRCRFKFHAECVQVVDNINDWICEYCLERIKELKSSNQWDYINNKQLKLQICSVSDQKRDFSSLIERIQKKEKIFYIEELSISAFRPVDQIAEFLKAYPLYKGANGKIKYPVLEKLAVDYPDVLEIKQKPKPYMINSIMVEQILQIQTTYQIMFPSNQTPQNVNQDYIEKNFYDILMNLIMEYFDELIVQDDAKFEQYYQQSNAHASSYLVILNYLYYNREAWMADLLKKTWGEFIYQLDQILNYDQETIIPRIDFDNIECKDQIEILAFLSDSLYDLDKMKEKIKLRDSPNNLKQSHLKILFQYNQSAFINCGTYLGQDAEDGKYFYFTHVPSSIFVETPEGWGQYTLSDLPELMGTLNLNGIHEQNLHENLNLISQVKLFSNNTPIKSQNRLHQNQQYALDIIEVIDLFLQVLDLSAIVLGAKKLTWIDAKQKQQFCELLKNYKSAPLLIQSLKQFFNGLIMLKQNGKFIKPFKLFKLQFELANQLAIYIDNTQSLSQAYIALLTLRFMLEEYQQHIQQKEQKEQKEQKNKKQQPKPKPQPPPQEEKVETKLRKRTQTQKSVNEDEQEQSNQQQGDSLANRREKRENAGKNPNISFEQKQTIKKVLCTSCGKSLPQSHINLKCSRCQKPYHQECLQSRKDFCKSCVKSNKKLN